MAANTAAATTVPTTFSESNPIENKLLVNYLDSPARKFSCEYARFQPLRALIEARAILWLIDVVNSSGD